MIVVQTIYVTFILFGSMLSKADMNEVYADYARPGGWNGMNFTMLSLFCLDDND